MDKTINISLRGHDKRFELDEDAYRQLAGYLERAGARLDADERADVLGDLEQSVGDRLSRLTESSDRPISATDMDRILDEIGPVDTGRESRPWAQAASGSAAEGTGKHRLHRIREAQWLAGVCTGLAEYAQVDVAWIRTGFVLGTFFTGGVLAAVYIALIFIMPVAPVHEPSRG